MTNSKVWRTVAALRLIPVLLALLGRNYCLAQGTTHATVPAFKVINGQQILIAPPRNPDGPADPLSTVHAAIVEDVTPCRSQDTAKPTYSCTPEESKADSSVESAAKSEDTTKRLSPDANSAKTSPKYVLTFPGGTFKTARVYRLTYWQVSADKTEHPKIVTVDTTPVVSIVSDVPVNGIYQFQLVMTVAFAQKGMTQTLVPGICPQKGDPAWRGEAGWVQVTFNNAPAGSAAPQAPILHGIAGPLSNLDVSKIENFDVNEIGSRTLCVAASDLKSEVSLSSGDVAKALADLQSPLGVVDGATNASLTTTRTFASGSKLAPERKAPTGKSDALFYANVNMVAATGAKFAWGLDGKVAYKQTQIFGSNWLITPLSATANVGNNTSSIKSQTYSDTIDWMLPFSRDFVSNHPAKCGKTLGDMLFSVAPDYETDIEFDKKNMLAAVDTVWNLNCINRTQSQRSKPKNGAFPTYPDPALNPIGYELQFHAGYEGGGALINTVQKASSGTAKITVPSYDIDRFVTQIHGLLQWIPARKLGNLTFDDTITGRYLFATENTVEQYTIPAKGSTAATVGLLLRPISGWKAYNSLVSSWYPPNSANVGFTATYNDGFNAPKFSRVNSVTVGVTIMY